MSVITITKADTLCKYMRAIEALKQAPGFDASDAQQVNSWLAGDVPAAQIGRTLRAIGYQVSTTRVKEHRLHDCNCSVAS